MDLFEPQAEAMPPTLDANADALKRVARGDPRAFGEVIQATGTKLFRLAVRLTGSPHDAEDVLQETYLRALGAARSGEYRGRASVQTWLYRIATNVALDWLRSRELEVRSAATTDASEARDARQLASTELRELQTELDQLPADQRLALVLKELEGLSSREVAAVLGCSEGAVEQRLVRARATLRARCERG